MALTRVFQNGNSQAIRIPAEMHTDRNEFIIRQVGEAFFIYPAEDPWLPLRQTIGSFPEEILFEREQPDWDEVPEREMF